MAVITYTSALIWEYVLLMIASGYFMFIIKKEFSMDDLLNYFIYLVTKIIAFIVFSSSILILIAIFTGFSDLKIDTFRQQLFYILVYYALINYSIFYLLKFINYVIEIYKKSDLSKFGLEKAKDGDKK